LFLRLFGAVRFDQPHGRTPPTTTAVGIGEACVQNHLPAHLLAQSKRDMGRGWQSNSVDLGWIPAVINQGHAFARVEHGTLVDSWADAASPHRRMSNRVWLLQNSLRTPRDKRHPDFGSRLATGAVMTLPTVERCIRSALHHGRLPATRRRSSQQDGMHPDYEPFEDGGKLLDEIRNRSYAAAMH
jgi:hypothetical protein